MNKRQFQQLAARGPILLDGATGTHLQAAGMPSGVSPEIWVLENPKVFQDLQRGYYAAGSSIVYAFTFGANRLKLAHHRQNPDDTADLNQRLAELSVQVRDEFRQKHPERTFLVAGDLAPTGCFLFPAGDLSLSELIDIYREQVRGLLKSGVDLFVVETMMDLAEARAAVLAVQAECDLPVMASLTFEESGRTLSGNPPLEAMLTLASLGVDAFGANCSFGPEKLGELILPITTLSPVPLLIKPNAGLPCLIDGQTIFPMDPQAFALALQPLAQKGIQFLGGCCGTSPAHLQQLNVCLQDPVNAALRQKLGHIDMPRMICSSRRSWAVENAASLPIIECADPDSLIDDVYELADDDPPAIRLDLDSIPADEDHLDALAEALQQLQVMVQTPLVFCSENQILLNRLVKVYNGRAGVISRQAGIHPGALIL